MSLGNSILAFFMYALHICDNFFQLTKGMFNADCLQFYSAKTSVFQDVDNSSNHISAANTVKSTATSQFSEQFSTRSFLNYWAQRNSAKAQCSLQNQDSFQMFFTRLKKSAQRPMKYLTQGNLFNNCQLVSI